MFHGDYSYELAKERMDEFIRDHEHDVFAKRLRAARKGQLPRKGMAAQGIAVVLAFFR